MKLKLIAVAAAIGLLIPTANAQKYIVTDIGKGFVTSIDKQGQVTGMDNTGNGFIYFKGKFTSIGAADPASINDHGQVTGSISASDGSSHIFLYTAGHIRDLGPGNGSQINNSGTLVGNSPPVDLGHGIGQAVISYNGGPLQTLSNINNGSAVYGINDFGQVVGAEFTFSPLTYHAFIWKAGQVKHIVGLGGSTAPFSINKEGHVVGTAETDFSGSNHWVGFLYKNGKIISFSGKGTFTSASDINSFDQVVGDTGPLPGGDNHAILFQNGIVIDLNSTVSLPNAELESAPGINDSGEIICNGRNFTDGDHGFLLTPIK